MANMSVSTKRTVWLAFAGLTILGALPAPAHAQAGSRRFLNRGPVVVPYPVNPNGFTGAFPTAQQFNFNARVVGNSIAQIPPYAFGYNPYPSPIISSGPVVNSPAYPATPYATLSTTPYAMGSPYGGTLSTGGYGGGGYGLSTMGGYGDSGYGYGGGGYGYGAGYGNSNQGSLSGLATYTQAQGNWQIQIQQARQLNEQVKMAQIDRARKQIQFEMWRESLKMTAPRMREQEAAIDLDNARNRPSAMQIWSGKALNDLLKSIKSVGKDNLKSGPQIDLSDVNLESVNLTPVGGQSNVGMLKATDKEGKLALNWPSAFDGDGFAKTVERLTRNLGEAVGNLRKKQKVDPTTLKDIRADYEILNKELAKTASTDALTPSQSIEARRFLKQLDLAIRALSDTNAARYFDDWKAQGKTVSALVAFLIDSGLEFAPAASGDEAAYSALYEALRTYERGLHQSSASQKTKD